MKTDKIIKKGFMNKLSYSKFEGAVIRSVKNLKKYFSSSMIPA